MTVLYSLTTFFNACMLFFVQPMIAKALLPYVGGAPTVWITCMLFFQVTLLAGYSFAWLTPQWIGLKLTSVIHLSLLAIAVFWLPTQAPSDWTPTSDGTPVFSLIVFLMTGIGVPFLALSASAPLLQSSYSQLSLAAASDPYFLYAASSLGSILALVAFPLAIEPWLELKQQNDLWKVGTMSVLVLTLICVAATWSGEKLIAIRSMARKPAPQSKKHLYAMNSSLRWTLLAFVPSSLLLGVTTYLTTDLAAVPLLWVLPLATYLLTFALTFARRPPIPHRWMVRLLPAVVVAMTLALLLQATEPLFLLVTGHLFLLFVVSMVCHGELAKARPTADRLGAFYFFLALGGSLGGVFNGLIAPLIFPGQIEYPAVLVVACMLAPPAWGKPESTRFVNGDIGWPLGVAALTAAATIVIHERALNGAAFGVAAVFCYTMAGRPRRFGLGIAALFLVGVAHEGVHGKTIYAERDFFGIHRVTLSADGSAHLLVHGNTVHGMQWLDPTRRKEALTYYHARGPIGSVFAHLQDRTDTRPVAIIGLGTGALASYAQVRQVFTFYEIDPAVIRIANDSRLFTYLRDCQTPPEIVVGDGRLALAQAPEQKYALIVIDAFSSDSIPLHLLTREALAIYRLKLAKGGILAFHVSNRYLDLAPVLGDMAGDAGMVCKVRSDSTTEELRKELGLYASQWVLLAEQEHDLPTSALWLALQPRPDVPVWTDGYCNLVGVLRWR